MARKRLSGPQPDYLMLETKSASGLSGPFPSDGPDPAPVPISRAPIAQIASETAALAAFDEVAGELRSAREEGRMMLRLALRDIDVNFLIRDRITPHDADLNDLTESIRERGQQTPIEVVDRGEGFQDGGRYGLISGWRRWTVLDDLFNQSRHPRFATVLALVRQPETGADAYIAMVEENEVRSSLSFYERARIVIRAVEAGIFPSEKAALQSLFANVSYAKRSKIKSFMPVVTAFDAVLRAPAHIPEHLGLALSQALTSHRDFAEATIQALKQADAMTIKDEQAVLTQMLAAFRARPRRSSPGVKMSGGPGRAVLSGDGVDEAFIERLTFWLADQSQH